MELQCRTNDGVPVDGAAGTARRTTESTATGIRVACYTPSSMWNLSRLGTSMRLLDPLSFGSPRRYIEVGGDPQFEDIYVDLDTFRHACDLPGVSSPPYPQDNYPDPRADEFSSVDGYNGDRMH